MIAHSQKTGSHALRGPEKIHKIGGGLVKLKEEKLVNLWAEVVVRNDSQDDEKLVKKFRMHFRKTWG